jgi:3'-phosphoadenosine 5'-phosphosulfate sulfotransferase (PAPS reductase)/FAD synthetase
MSNPDYVISVSYGNDSLAMIQWAHESGLAFFRTVVAYCDTGWAAPGWDKRVTLGEAFAISRGFDVVRLTSIGMEELVRIKKGWPGNGQQFCTAHLKGVPYLQWLDEIDRSCQAVTLVGKRRAESADRADTPEFIEASDYHGGRRLWHPLYAHSDQERDALLDRAGIHEMPAGLSLTQHDRLYRLPHRSMECNPCVNANRGDFLRLTPPEMARVNRMETEIGKPMFRPKRFNGVGIYSVVMWARHGKDHEADLNAPAKFTLKDTQSEPPSGCAAEFGCGL